MTDEPLDFSDLGGKRVALPPGYEFDFSDLGGQRVGHVDAQQPSGGFFGRFGDLGPISVQNHPEWLKGWPTTTASPPSAPQQGAGISAVANQQTKLLDFSDLGGQRVAYPEEHAFVAPAHARVTPATPDRSAKSSTLLDFGDLGGQRVALPGQPSPASFAAASLQTPEPPANIRQYTPDDELRDWGGTHEGVISAPKAVESGKITPLDIPSPDMHVGYRVGRWLDQKLANMIGHPELAQQAEDAMTIHVPDKLNTYLGTLEQRLGFWHPLPGTEPNLYEVRERAETPFLKRLPSDVAGEIQKDPQYGKRKIYDPVAIVEGLGQGSADILAGLSTPENIVLMAAMGRAPRPVNAIAGAGFAGQMAHGAVDQGQKAIELYRQGKSPEAIAAITGMTVNAVMAVLSAKGAASETGRPTTAEVEKAAIDQVINRREELEHKYVQDPETQLRSGGVLRDADIYKKYLMPKGNAYKNAKGYTDAVHPSSSEAAQAAFRDDLENFDTNRPVAELITGMAGSGKTTIALETAKSDVGTAISGNFSDPVRVDRYIKEIVESGHRARIVHVFVDPVTAFERAIYRGAAEGRYLNYDAFKRMAKVNDTILQIAEKYAGLGVVDFEFYDNNGPYGSEHRVTLDEFRQLENEQKAKYNNEGRFDELIQKKARELWQRKLAGDRRLAKYTADDQRKATGR